MEEPGQQTLEGLNRRIVACERCPRLRQYCAQVAEQRRKAYRDWEYWGRPVPSFGDPEARVLLLGLAPGAHGSNRTGRPFTGDGSGDFMYPVLHEAGFASQPLSRSREDGMVMRDMWVTSVVRCAPPENKPLPEELRNCSSYLDEGMVLLKNLRVVICLGKIAFDGYVSHLLRTGQVERRAAYPFGHATEYQVRPGQWLIASYHPSLQNTNTGKLTRDMLLQVFQRARKLACSDDALLEVRT